MCGDFLINAEHYSDDILPVWYHLNDKSDYNPAIRNAIWGFKDWHEICLLCQMCDFGSTVNICSKGSGRKGNPPLRDIDFSRDAIFFNYSYIGSEGISMYGKNLSGSMKSQSKV